MSLISDALKKAELQRAQPSLAPGAGWDRGTQRDGEPRKSAATSSRVLFAANVAVLAIICVIAFYFVRNQPMAASTDSQIDPPQTLAQPAMVTIDPAVAPKISPETSAAARSTVVSPFNPPALETAVRPPAATEYSLGGTSSLGSTTLLSVIRKSDRRSIWVPVGKTVGEVTAVSYDPDSDQGVIRVRGNLLSITMSDSGVSSDSGSGNSPTP
jgi:hypothetical protein